MIDFVCRKNDQGISYCHCIGLWCQYYDDAKDNYIGLFIAIPIIAFLVCAYLCVVCCKYWAARKSAPRAVMTERRPMYVPSQPAPIPTCV
ncbi:unnamed protein product [Vitrella brassicaformis CCMP3155]|uniref:Uncharacterized protein n=1 Tax=Vitrella brassicaformis (strain CCMP3155) TaxID=1169540 RepID=A0A0G4G7K3_VITBC|nr:unnamed protein product [Vitrella brassicaformis CCMP3155]|eukprot:CEM24616.1 unnamed protein product [Vitrella brassicaformis CCMP3155]